MRTRYILFGIMLITILLIAGVAGCVARADSSAATSTTPTLNPKITLTVSAAASLTDVLKEIDTVYTRDNPNTTILTNFAASGTLQQQIENGAPVDIFISAAAAQMDSLQKEQLILNDTRKNLLTNQLVLIVPSNSTLGITSFQDLTAAKVKKIAIGDPKFVPCGTYTQQTFNLLGITAQLQSKLVLGNDVRQVLTYVETGNVDAGVVFSTDAMISPQVKVVASAPNEINSQIVYPVAVVKDSKSPEAAREYENFLFSPQAKAVFEKYGFVLAGN